MTARPTEILATPELAEFAPPGTPVESWQQRMLPESWKDKNKTLVQAIEICMSRQKRVTDRPTEPLFAAFR